MLSSARSSTSDGQDRVSGSIRSRSPIDPKEFRRTLGHFCSGVTLLAGYDADGSPLGMACQSFTSLSLDPPLILVCPGQQSKSWPRIAASGRFSVNVLADDQAEISAAVGRSGPDKFAGIDWQKTPHGALVLDGVLAWLDCDIETVHPGGDHWIVVGAVRQLAVVRDGDPLLFFRGGYGLPDSSDPR